MFEWVKIRSHESNGEFETNISEEPNEEWLKEDRSNEERCRLRLREDRSDGKMYFWPENLRRIRSLCTFWVVSRKILWIKETFYLDHALFVYFSFDVWAFLV